MPAASDDLMHSFYPLLANAMIQADLDSVEDEGSAAVGERRSLKAHCRLVCLQPSPAADHGAAELSNADREGNT
jgi:hypothetical protein